MKSVLAGVALVFLAGAPALAQEDVEDLCQLHHPARIWDFFARRDCIKLETEKQRKEQERLAREERARICIAGDLARMEELATKVTATLNSEMSLEEVRTALRSVLGRGGDIAISNDNIKERVIVNAINTKCDSDFHLLINVRANEAGNLRWLNVWAENAPKGYESGLRSEFSISFDAQRFERSMQAAKAESERKQEAAKEELLKRQQIALRAVKLNASMSCWVTDCKTVSFDVGVINGSKEVIYSLSLGWTFPAPQDQICPSQLSTKRDERTLFLQPGETRWVHFYATDAPGTTNPRYCLQLTGISIRP